MLPDDLAGKVRELQAYDFTSAEAQQRFEQLMEKLKQQLMQQAFDQMSGAMQNMTPEDMQRMKDMMAALNEMLAKHAAGKDPGFEEFMQQYGDFFPENPQTLEELMEIMAQRMAAMQAMLNSMTPEQRAQLQALSEQLLDDMDLRWQMDQLASATCARCSRRWGGTAATTSRAPTRWASARRCRRCRSSATSTSSRTCCATRPARRRSPRPTWTRCATCSATTPPSR